MAASHQVGPNMDAPFGTSLIPKKVENTGENIVFDDVVLGRQCPRVAPMWGSINLGRSCSQTGPAFGQVAPCWTSSWGQLEPSGPKLGSSLALLAKVEPMLRWRRIEAANLDDIAPIRKTRKLPQQGNLFLGTCPGGTWPSAASLTGWFTRWHWPLDYHALAPSVRADFLCGIAVCICMCIYIYTYIVIYTYLHYLHMFTFIYTFLHFLKHILTLIYTYLHMFTFVYIYVHVITYIHRYVLFI